MNTSDSLSVQVCGNGKTPLVMVHGWAMHSGLFAPLLKRLNDDFRLYLLDLPGHGANHGSEVALTPTAVINHLLDSIPEEAIWLGWSMGGLFAIEAARQGLASGLVMLASTPCFVQRADWSHAVKASVFEDFAMRLQTSVSDTLKRFLLLETHGADNPREVMREMQTALASQPQPHETTLRAGLDLLCQSDARETMERLDLPVLWLAGRRDRLVPWQAARAMAAGMSQSRVRLLSSAGHSPFVTHGDKIAESLRRFAAHTSASTA